MTILEPGGVHYVKTGAGVAYGITDSVDVFGSFVRQVAGRNGHSMDRGITIGASWGFALRKPRAPSDRQQRSLVRCICQKSRR